MIKNFAPKKFFLIFALTVLTIILVACNKGSLKLEKLSIDYTSIKTTYVVGDTLDFSGFKATAIYNDESLNTELTYDDVEFKYNPNITTTTGEKEVTISFVDPHLNIVQKFPLKIKVLSDIAEDTEGLIVIAFDKPSGLISFLSDNKKAGTSQYGAPGFSSEFAVGNNPYIIGNENEFRFVPEFAIFDKQGEIRKLDAFFSTVDINIYLNGVPFSLKKVAIGNNIVEYYYNNNLVVTVDTYRGIYNFTDYAAGKDVQIKVLPDDKHYDYNSRLKAISLQASVVKAYNVYEAWQLSVIDNSSDDLWADIKKEHGIYGLEVSGIVLHNDITITAKDVPQSLFYTTTKDVYYTNAFTGEQIVVPAGTKYLKDSSRLFYRKSDSDFSIEGNLFTLSISGFPYVPSPSVFGPDAGLDFGQYFSGAALLEFITTVEYSAGRPEQAPVITINNLSIIGNSSRDNIVDAGGVLVAGGGLTFLYADVYTEISVNNVIGNSYFTTYKLCCGSVLNGSNIKCYDSYLNAASVMRDSVFTVTDSYFNGSGGPAILAINYPSIDKYATVNIYDTITETALTGQELWFQTMNINAFMPQIEDLNNLMIKAGLGSFKNEKGHMNVMGILTADGSSVDEIILNVKSQGVMFFDGGGIDRSNDDEHWSRMKFVLQPIADMVDMSPLCITVQDEKGKAYTILYDGFSLKDINTILENIGDISNIENWPGFSPDPNSSIYKAFKNAKSVTLTMGGISIVAGLYHD